MANVKSIIAAHLSQRQREINKQTERAALLDEDRLLCSIIRVDGNINVPNKPGFVWCQEYSPSDDTSPFPAFSGKIQAREGLPVWIGEGAGSRREVLDWNNATIVNTPDYNAQKYLPQHASDHAWPDFKPGPDALNIYPRSLTMLRAYPGEAGLLTVSVSALRYIKDGAVIIFPGTNSLDISASQPASGLARFVLIYLDWADNTIKTADGATTSDSPAVMPNSPAFPSSAILSALVRLDGDQTSVSEVDFVDVRQVLSFTGPGAVQVSELWESDFGAVAAQANAGGYIGVNTADPTWTWEAVAISSRIFIETADSDSETSLTLNRSSDTAYRSAVLAFTRARAGPAIVADADRLGVIAFYAYDGTDFNTGAIIEANIDGTPAANVVPTALSFQTTETNNAGMTERLNIAADGLVTLSGDLLLTAGSQDYLFTNRASTLVLQAQTSGSPLTLEMYTKDGDGTDNVGISLWGIGLPEAITNRERLLIKYEETNLQYEIFTEAGGTGTLRDLVIYTEGNTDQLKLETDGSITLGGGTQDYNISRRNNVILTWQGQVSAQASAFEIYTKDGDGTDTTSFSLYGVGVPSDVSNRERLLFRYDAPNTEFSILTEAEGTGTLRPLVLFTEGNTDQLKLHIDGHVSISDYLEGTEISAPGAGAANTWRLYAVDNGGKTELYAIFNTGAAQLIAAQP